ncbi:MAG: hypothetical protein DRQ62_01685 [Gammaproteobacteria bacterium]|nr:MAG: hypothetical protein DRQ62_01685 [Gammaproteobacteria bacterium]
MRIIARIDDVYAQKLRTIQQITHLNTTEIIKRALDLLYEKTELTAKEKNQKLLDKLAGIGTGPKDGSVNYKKYISEYLDEKLGHR